MGITAKKLLLIKTLPNLVKMKRLFTFLMILFGLGIFAQPANDNCTNSTNLTVNNPLLCFQNMASSSIQASECTLNYGGGTTSGSVWYNFTATQTQQVLNFILSNSPGCFPTISVFGPFASVAAGCSTAGVFGAPCGGAPAYNWTINNNYQGTENAFYLLSNGDPGIHTLLTGLTVGSVYLIRIQDATGSTCGGTMPNFCISVNTPALNSSIPTASLINACGQTFTGTTNGGYYNNGQENGGGFGNLDNNMTTTCPSCVSIGDDVNFVINNVSWYTFCAASAGTWNVQFAVSNCIISAPNNGAQIAVFTGTPTALNQVWQSVPSCAGTGNGQVPVGCTVVSSNFNVAAGTCAYMAVDGFAGDACAYSLVLTNVLGGCVILPVELTGFSAKCDKGRLTFEWATATEKNSQHFTIEKSLDGKIFIPVGEVKAAGNSSSARKYIFSYKDAYDNLAYYRLTETDMNGSIKIFNTEAVKGCEGKNFVSWAYGNNINISVNSNVASSYQIELYNTSGVLVMSKEQVFEQGSSTISIPTEVETGIYFMRVTGGEETQNKKIFIQK
jgi:hypothetical protein